MDTATSAVFHGFPARAYLDKYYRRVGAENTVLLHAVGDFVRAHRGPTASLIEVAGGPSLFTTMAVAAERGLRFERLTFTDIAWQNLEEVRWWLADDPRGFDYSELLAWLASERGRDPGLVVETLRGSRWDLVQRDWLVADDASFDGSYDVVSSHFFAESATSSEDEFLSMLAKVGRLGRPGA
ncbi:MAG: hypothetical protein QOG63_2834, partial [Thermoleophilaceae bacterium]|nr:hypothetical protein [Thermoleophilaceae bacterium]